VLLLFGGVEGVAAKVAVGRPIMSAERELHEPREMKIEVIVADQYRAKCLECEASVVITPEQGKTGTATCYGNEILVAWNPFADFSR
jgi:hypothetical protein